MWCLKGVDLLLCDVSVRLDEVLVKWLELGEVASASHAVHRLLAFATGVTVQVSLEHVFRHEMAAAFGLYTSVPVTDRNLESCLSRHSKRVSVSSNLKLMPWFRNLSSTLFLTFVMEVFIQNQSGSKINLTSAWCRRRWVPNLELDAYLPHGWHVSPGRGTFSRISSIGSLWHFPVDGCLVCWQR